MPSLEQLGKATEKANCQSVKEIVKAIEQKQTDAIIEKIQSVLAMTLEEIPPKHKSWNAQNICSKCCLKILLQNCARK